MLFNRNVIILLAVCTLFGLAVLQRSPATAQEPAGITLTPTEPGETPTATEQQVTATPTEPIVTPTNTQPVITSTPTDTGSTSTPTEVIITGTVTATPTEGITIPPPFDTDTPTPGSPDPQTTRTPPVLPATGQSPFDGGFPVEGLFAGALLVLVGWFFLRGLFRVRAD